MPRFHCQGEGQVDLEVFIACGCFVGHMGGAAGQEPGMGRKNTTSCGMEELEPSGKSFFCGKSEDQGGWEKGCHDNLWGFPRKPWSPWQLHHSGRN